MAPLYYFRMRGYSLARRSKKAAEAAEQALANRVRLLERREEEAYRSANSAHLRLQHFLRIKHTKEHRAGEQESAELRKTNERSTLHEELLRRRQSSHFSLAMGSHKLECMRLRRAQQVKTESQQHSHYIHALQLSVQSEKRSKVFAVKRAAARSAERKRELMSQRFLRVQTSYRQRIKKEQAAQEAQEKLVEELEMQELDCLQRLRRTQQLHKDLLAQLPSTYQVPNTTSDAS